MKNQPQPREYVVKQLLCRRTGRQFAPEKHERCPYCFGEERDILAGHHEDFCDYLRGVDAASFGFPAGAQRHEQG